MSPNWLIQFLAICFLSILNISPVRPHGQSDQLKQLYFPFHNQTLALIDLVLHDEQRSTSNICDKSLLQLRDGLVAFEEWALKFYEASGKPKNGELFGYNGDLGDYDQCLSIHSESQNAVQFAGQYCLVSIQTERSELIKSQPLYRKNAAGLSESAKFITDFSLGTVQGICLPSTCDINAVLDSINKAIELVHIVPQKHCSVANQVKEFSNAEIIAFSVFGLLILLCIISTLLPYGCLDHFHIGRNFAKLTHINDSVDATTTSHLHGTKTCYLMAGITGHIWGMLMPFAPFLYGGFKSMHFHWALRSILDRLLIGPDMMFFLSGFLSMWTWYAPMRKFRIGLRKYIVIRFLRCLTVVGIAILGGYIWPRLGSGPYFTELSEHFHQSCSERVWKNLLMINNQDRMLDICALPTWFLSSDFQLYVQHYLTIHFFATRPGIGFLVATIQMLLNSAYTILDSYQNGYPKLMVMTNSTALHSIEIEQQYFYTYLHSNVYTLGIICGWLVVSKKAIQLSSLSMALIWISTLTLTLSVFYLPDLWHYGYMEVHSGLLYAWPVISRILFISSIFWGMYSMSFGYNRMLKRMLSCRFMISISRMSMSMVTCQFLYLWYYLGSRRDLIRLTMFDLIREGVLAFFVCWFIGFLMYLFIEAPVVSVLYTLLGLRRRIELTEKVRELNEQAVKEQEAKEREAVEQAAKELAVKAEKELKEKIAKLAEPILDENANITGDYKFPDQNIN